MTRNDWKELILVVVALLLTSFVPVLWFWYGLPGWLWFLAGVAMSSTFTPYTIRSTLARGKSEDLEGIVSLSVGSVVAWPLALFCAFAEWRIKCLMEMK